jgi:hypothetical protein
VTGFTIGICNASLTVAGSRGEPVEWGSGEAIIGKVVVKEIGDVFPDYNSVIYMFD